jgi:hypothetical protein
LGAAADGAESVYLRQDACGRDSIGVAGATDAAVSVERHVGKRQTGTARQIGDATRRAGVVG